jgi:hypothetical protein
MAVQDVIVASVPVADKEREGVLPRKAGVRAQQGGRLRSEMRWILVAPEGHQHADAGRLATVDPPGSCRGWCSIRPLPKLPYTPDPRADHPGSCEPPVPRQPLERWFTCVERLSGERPRR